MGPMAYVHPGHWTLVGTAADAYTMEMKGKALKTLCFRALGAAFAALLLAALPAAAKPKKKAASKVDSQAQRLLSEGLAELERGEYSAAIAHLNKAVRRQSSVSSYFLLGWAHYQRGFKQGSAETADRDDAQSAIDAYRMALDLDPRLSTLPDRSRLYFSLALCNEAVESYGPALEAYKSALKAAPSKALIPLHAARLRLKMKDADKALTNVQMALSKARMSGHEGALIALVKRDPAFAPLLADERLRRALGAATLDPTSLLAANNPKEEELRDAVRDRPRPAPPAQDPAVLEQIAQGNVEFKFRRYQNAITAYGEALTLNQKKTTLSAGQIAALHEKIGAAENKIGQSDQAILSLQKSLQQNPRNAGTHYQIALAYALSGKASAALRALKESFAAAGDQAELRRLVLLAKTDIELEAVRDLPGFGQAVSDVAGKIALR